MARRMISDSIWKNEKYALLPFGARLLLVGLVTNADDQGRGKAHPTFLRAEIFPYDEISSTEISEWLRLIEANETIIIYKVDGKEYYQLSGWWKYQSHPFAAPSEFPKPSAWTDRIRTTTKGRVILTCNWITSDNALLPNTCDEHGKPVIHTNGKPPVPPTDDPTPNQVNDQVDNHVVNQVNNHVEHQRESKRESKRETTTTAPARETAQADGDVADSGGGSLPPQKPDAWQEVVHAYESNIGMFTQMSSEMVQAAVAEYGSILVVDAIKESVRQNTRKWSYVEGILRRWQANGRDSPKFEEEKRTPKTITIFNQYTGQHEQRIVS